MDFEQIEFRLLAYYMAGVGDTSMVEVFETGEDLHNASAQAIFNTESPTEEEREGAKTFNYATIYGQGVKKCAAVLTEKLGRIVELDEAQAMLNLFHGRWPGIKLLSNPYYRFRGENPGAIERRLAERGYITTLYGRHLHPLDPHKGLNYLIQGTAADIMRSSFLKVHNYLKENKYVSHIVNVVHDELILDIIKAEMAELVAKVPPLMGNLKVEEIIPLPVEVEYSETSWANKEPLKQR